MSLNDCFLYEIVDVPHSFLRTHVTIQVSSNDLFETFYLSFREYFLNLALASTPKQWMQKLLNHETIESEEKDYLKNSLRRIFNDDEHLKGLIGEYILGFEYNYLNPLHLWSYGPKSRSSAEAGIDYIVFLGSQDDYQSITFIVWEAKTTELSATKRASEIYDFFSKDGSLQENIDCEISMIQQIYENKPESNLKNVIKNMQLLVINEDKKFNIGACAILCKNVNLTEHTFGSFEKCFPTLSKEQRLVKFVLFKSLDQILERLKNEIWRIF